jgi:uncharacterized protein (DUF362 family)
MSASPEGPTVSVVPTGTSIVHAVAEAMELAGVLDAIEPGAPIALKPNLGFDLYVPGAVTSPPVVEGVIRALRDRAGSITIVESDQVLVDIEKAFRRCGMEPLLRRHDVRFENMSKGRFVDVPVPNHRQVEALRLPEILTRATLVTVPVMKTHNKSTITCAIKNQWGCLDTFRHNYHLVLTDVLADIHKVLKPAFAVCDATVAMEGDGPKTGVPRRVDRVLASRDIVALDSVVARMMGFDPREIDHLRALQDDGCGTQDGVRVVGESIEGLDLDFASAHHNAVSFVEMALRHTPLSRAVFHTRLLDVMCAGANAWYRTWYYLGPGHRLGEITGVGDPREGR